MEIKTITNQDEQFFEKILDFYETNYNADRAYYLTALRNSPFICLALENGKVIGACRILTDMKKHGHIVDLIVDKQQRSKGIGGKLLDEAAKKCKELGLSYFGLTCRPELIDFYTKHDFSPKDDTIYMKYQTKANSSEPYQCKVNS